VSQPCDNEPVQTKEETCWLRMGETGGCSKKVRTAQVQNKLSHGDFGGFESIHGSHVLRYVDDG
jgi:hypothetical protein